MTPTIDKNRVENCDSAVSFSPATANPRGLWLCLLIACVLTTAAGAHAAGSYTVLHTFDATDRFHPQGALIQGSDGNLYSASAAGFLYQITLAGTVSTLHTFDGATSYSREDPSGPTGPLIQGKDGALYGLTASGGPTDTGTFYRTTLSGDFSVLHAFVSSEGSIRENGVAQGSDGNFYGTSYEGGANGGGTIFRITATGLLTVLHDFSAPHPSDNAHEHPAPYFEHHSSLVQGQDGNLYGTTAGDGVYNFGSLYKITPQGQFTVLHTFGYLDPAGSVPNGLVQGSDGNFYGIAGFHFNQGPATIFQVTPAGVLTTVYTFNRPEVSVPGSLFPGSDGNIYGLGRSNFYGAPVLYRFVVGGSVVPLYYFRDTKSTGAPSAVIQGSDGSFYGADADGSPRAYFGLLFRLVISPSPVVTVTMPSPQVSVSGGQDGEFLFSLPSAAASDLPLYYTLQGSATNGVDYTFLKGTAKIKAGQMSRLIRIIPMGNLGGAAKKTVKLTLVPSDGYTPSNPAPPKIKILAVGP